MGRRVHRSPDVGLPALLIGSGGIEMSTTLKRFICQKEDCNRSFYTYHSEAVICCPYCRSVEVRDYDPKSKLRYRIDAVEIPLAGPCENCGELFPEDQLPDADMKGQVVCRKCIEKMALGP